MIDMERTFRVDDGGKHRDVVVRWRSVPPVRDGERGVAIEVTGAEEAWTMTIYGIDELQALCGAIMIARTHLETTRAFKEGRLEWFTGTDLGLPIAPPMADR